MINLMAAWILAQNEEHHDVATSLELALLAGLPLSHGMPRDRGPSPVVVTVASEDDAPVSAVLPTVRVAA